MKVVEGALAFLRDAIDLNQLCSLSVVSDIGVICAEYGAAFGGLISFLRFVG